MQAPYIISHLAQGSLSSQNFEPAPAAEQAAFSTRKILQISLDVVS